MNECRCPACFAAGTSDDFEQVFGCDDDDFEWDDENDLAYWLCLKCGAELQDAPHDTTGGLTIEQGDSYQ